MDKQQQKIQRSNALWLKRTNEQKKPRCLQRPVIGKYKGYEKASLEDLARILN